MIRLHRQGGGDGGREFSTPTKSPRWILSNCLLLFFWTILPFDSGAEATPSSGDAPRVAEIAGGRYGGDGDGGGDDDRTLYVHVVPHTHDDVGWLKTVDQYYYGRNNTIQRAQVRYILDTVVLALGMNPNRTFTYVEIAFFSRWWDEQTEETRDVVRDLVRRGRLTFSNGGWCMHDEAATHYMGMIDQTTLGHAFLRRELGVVPTVGWQLDPFGHSATQASLLTARAGFDALFFGRIDRQDLESRHGTGQCEGLWDASASLDDARVFWGLTGSYGGGYGPPTGFCFDAECNDDYLIGEDEEVLLKRLGDFLRQVKVQSDRTKGQNVMLTMGEDFQYDDAFVNFENLDFLISSVMRYQASGNIDVPSMFSPRFNRVEVFYSTPELYVQHKHRDFLRMASREYTVVPPKDPCSDRGSVDRSDGATDEGGGWDVKTDDFFPYSDCDHCYWTGYFASRPALKRLERVGSSFLHMARQVESYAGRGRSDGDRNAFEAGSGLRKLEEAMGVAQHHDAVSGTSKQHVAYDYAKKIQAGINEAEAYVVGALRNVLLDGGSSDLWENLSYCQRLNETVCQVSQQATMAPGTDLYIVAYNALTARNEFVSVPVSASTEYSVERLVRAGNGAKLEAQQWEEVPSVLIPNSNPMGTREAGAYLLHFDAGELTPFGASVFRIRSPAIAPPEEARRGDVHVGPLSFELPSVGALPKTRLLRSKVNAKDTDTLPEHLVVSNEHIQVEFQSGLIAKISSPVDDGVGTKVMQEWGYYTSFDDGGKSQSSGAYIFRPKIPDQDLRIVSPDPSKSHVFRSSLVTEVHVGFEEPWIKQITRIRAGQPFVEMEYTIGPIPVDDNVGKEIATRFSSGIRSDGIFYTDSNGREFMKRKRSFRPTWDLRETEPVAGNYYPVNAAIYIEDDAASMSVLVDRSQGGSSLADGRIELVVHRRTLADDARGVGEPLNETDVGISPYPPFGDASRLGKGIVISGTHRIMVGKSGDGARLARSLMDKMFSPPHLFAASAPSDKGTVFQSPSFSILQEVLPENVMLVTYSKVDPSNETLTFLIRLGHQYAKGEDMELSKPVRVDMDRLLAGYDVVSVVEMTLTGNQAYSSWEKRRLPWHKEPPVPTSGANGDGNVVKLNPMEIKTFEVQVKVSAVGMP